MDKQALLYTMANKINYTILLFSLLTTLLISCNDDTSHQLNGMWQLKGVSNEDKNIVSVDSVFYGFQSERIFSFTILKSDDESDIYYGYIDFPTDNTIHIAIDRNYQKEQFLKYSGWNGFSETFSLVINNNEATLVSEANQKAYYLRRF